MHDSGLVRRIDDLGRIVIPKELRKNLRIKSGDAIQISKDEDAIVLKKYNPTDSLFSTIQSLAESVYQSTKKACIVTDTDKIIYSTNKALYEQNCILNNFCHKVMQDRKVVAISSAFSQIPSIYMGENIENINSRILIPYVKDGDCYGLIILSGIEKEIAQEEIKILAFSALFLSGVL